MRRLWGSVIFGLMVLAFIGLGATAGGAAGVVIAIVGFVLVTLVMWIIGATSYAAGVARAIAVGDHAYVLAATRDLRQTFGSAMPVALCRAIALEQTGDAASASKLLAQPLPPGKASWQPVTDAWAATLLAEGGDHASAQAKLQAASNAALTRPADRYWLALCQARVALAHGASQQALAGARSLENQILLGPAQRQLASGIAQRAATALGAPTDA